MRTKLQRKSISQLSKSILAGLAGSLLGAVASTAQEANAPTAVKPTVVTGSYIPTAETVGPSPIDTVATEAIQKTGQQDILTSLKILNAGFSGGYNIGHTVNNGGFGEAYIAIRNLPTLVLIDGERVNITPFSTFFGTFAVDVNTIPLAAIDRIEVLKDGASTTYGSDAIGGVVNIITKKDLQGGPLQGPYNYAQVDAHVGMALDKGTYNEERYDAVVGYNNNGTKLMAGGQYYYSDPIYTRDRPPGGITAQQLQSMGLLAPTYYSPSYPGRVANFLLAGSPLAVGAPGYIAGLNSPPNDPYIMSQMALLPTSMRDVPHYNSIVQSDPAWITAHPGAPAPYIAINTTPASIALGGSPSILNTTTLNTITVERQDRRNAFANVEQNILEDHLVAYGQVLYSENESVGQLAPSPIPLLSLYNLTIPADNPYNIFQVPIGSGATNSTPRVRSRLIETGNRKFDTFSDSWHFVGGLKGKVLDNKYGYDMSAGYSQTTQQQVQNSANSVLVNEAMTPFGNTGLSVLTDGSGHVPIYNMFALPGFNNSRTVQAIKASDFQGGFSDLLEVKGIFNGEIFPLPAGPFKMAAGGQWLAESLKTTAGPILSSGDLIGLNAIPPFGGGSRDRFAGFVEASIPVFTPQKNVPGFYDLELSAAGRYEVVESGGTSHEAKVPKVGFRWQPVDDQWTLRGTYSQGFVVPPLIQLFGPPLQGNPTLVIDGVAAQQTVNTLSNPDLPPAESEVYTLGTVFTPKAIKGLTISVDYYHILEKGVFVTPSGSAVVKDLNANGMNSFYWNNPAWHGTPVYTVNGAPYAPTPGNPATFITADNFDTMNLALLPGGAQRTDGIDFGLDYKLETKNAGTIDLFANANLILGFDFKVPNGSWFTYKGQYTDGQVVPGFQQTMPDYNITMGLTWSILNFDYTILAHYIPPIVDLGDSHPAVGSPVNDFTQNGLAWQVPAYYKIDMQLAYNFRSDSGKKWYDGTRVAFGCNNITDEPAPVIASSSEDNTDKATYDILGRFIYLELSKKF